MSPALEKFLHDMVRLLKSAVALTERYIEEARAEKKSD
jgi:hypothetical protein